MCIMAMCVTGVYAQQGVSPASRASIRTGGKFNSSTQAGGSASDTSLKTRKPAEFPLYTKLDTVSNTNADTLYQYLYGPQWGVYSWVHVNSISGTNTSCVVKCQVTGDVARGTDWSVSGGTKMDWYTVATYTVSATGNPYTCAFNSGNMWLYTNMRWIFTGVGTHSSSWYCGLNVD